ncbi:hypothetical protein [Methylocapsa sp. S129]|uniref:hypothetical protein n=1 Tax=Methylocapsa sp. S129 TaxID=1641869 RepID=UPI00131A90EB|nr:hypothetical protein [Methylocapsa sp. S129]
MSEPARMSFMSKIALDMLFGLLGLCFLYALFIAFLGGNHRIDPTAAAIGVAGLLPILIIGSILTAIAAIVFAANGRPGLLILFVVLFVAATVLIPSVGAYNRRVLAAKLASETIRLEAGRKDMRLFLSQSASKSYPQLAEASIPIVVKGFGPYDASAKSIWLAALDRPLGLLSGRVPDKEHPLELLSLVTGTSCLERDEIISMLSYASVGAFDQCDAAAPLDQSSDHFLISSETILGKFIRPEFDSLNFTQIKVYRVSKGEEELIFTGANFEGETFPHLPADRPDAGLGYAASVMAAVGLADFSKAQSEPKDGARLMNVSKGYIFDSDSHIRHEARSVYETGVSLRQGALNTATDVLASPREELTQQISATTASYISSGSPEGLMAAFSLARYLTRVQQQPYLLDAARAIVHGSDRDMIFFAGHAFPICRYLESYDGRFPDDVRAAATQFLTPGLSARAYTLVMYIRQYGGPQATKCF